jgi:hypothetical protein
MMKPLLSKAHDSNHQASAGTAFGQAANCDHQPSSNLKWWSKEQDSLGSRGEHLALGFV